MSFILKSVKVRQYILEKGFKSIDHLNNYVNAKKIEKATLDKQDKAYNKKMLPIYDKYGQERAILSGKAVEKYINKLKDTTKLAEKHIKAVEKIIADIYSKDIDKIFRDPLSEVNRELYYYRLDNIKKGDYVGLKKAEIPYDETTILGINEQTINTLTTADLVWVSEHAKNTILSRVLAREMAYAQKQGMTIRETAAYLQETVKFDLPKAFIERFGEERYYRMVTRVATQRVRSYAYVNDLDFAGYTEYRIIPRPDACPICIAASETTYKVSDARERITEYDKYAQDGNVDKMKEADPFWNLDNVVDGKGVIVPIHPD